MKTTDVMTLAATRIEATREYYQDIACVDSGSQAADPVRIYGRNGWTSTPFQNAGFKLADIAGWLYSEGREVGYLADISSDGSAEIYSVDYDQDPTYPAELEQVESLPAIDLPLEEMIAVLERHGDRFTGNCASDEAQDWLDHDFDAETADEWCEIGVWDAATAAELRDADLTPAEASAASDALCDEEGDVEESRFVDGSPIYSACNNDIDVHEIIDAARTAR